MQSTVSSRSQLLCLSAAISFQVAQRRKRLSCGRMVHRRLAPRCGSKLWGRGRSLLGAARKRDTKNVRSGRPWGRKEHASQVGGEKKRAWASPWYRTGQKVFAPEPRPRKSMWRLAGSVDACGRYEVTDGEVPSGFFAAPASNAVKCRLLLGRQFPVRNPRPR